MVGKLQRPAAGDPGGAQAGRLPRRHAPTPPRWPRARAGRADTPRCGRRSSEGLLLRAGRHLPVPARPRAGGGLLADPRERARARCTCGSAGCCWRARRRASSRSRSSTIVNQLNRGAALITRRERARADRRAQPDRGQAREGVDRLRIGAPYFVTGAALLGRRRWERRRELTFALELHRAECEFLTGALEAAEGASPSYRAAPRASSTWRRSPALRVGSLHDPRTERPRRRGLPRLPAARRHRLAGASDRRARSGGIRADVAAARGSPDRGAGRPAADDRSGCARDDGRARARSCRPPCSPTRTCAAS